MNADAEKVEMHFNSLDFIKICATFAIIFHHYQEFLKIKFDYINFYYGMFPYHSMVFLFFIISGFFISKYRDEIIEKKKTFKSFIKRRVNRLLPMTALTALIYEVVLIIFAFLTKTTFNNYTTEMGISGMGILNGFGMIVTMIGTGAGWFWKGPMANEVTWYICVLFLCYIVFYLCCRITNHIHVSANYVFVGVIMVGLACASYGANLPFFNANSLQGYIPFFIGIMLGEFMEKRGYFSCGIVLVLGMAGLIISALYIAGMILYTKEAFVDNYWLMFVTFPSLIIVFLSKPVKNVFRHQIWQFLGGVSFNVYVWHFICIILLLAFNIALDFPLPVDNRWFMVGFSGVIFLIGTFSYFFIEPMVGSFTKKIYGKIKDTENLKRV